MHGFPMARLQNAIAAGTSIETLPRAQGGLRILLTLTLSLVSVLGETDLPDIIST